MPFQGNLCWPENRLECTDGAEDFLDCFYRPRSDRGFYAADLVGTGGNRSDNLCELVGGLSQRLVLSFSTTAPRPLAASSIYDAPTTTGWDSGGRSLR